MIPPAIRLLLALCTAACFAVPALAARSFAVRDDVRVFVEEMESRHGFDRAELLAVFGQIQPLPAVIKAIKPPADPGIRSWLAYRGRFVEPRRIAAGLRFWDEHADALRSASARYGVPEEVIVAIIGIETIYGRNTGRFGTLAALATLAFDYPPRAELFRRELEALLLLAREEGRSPLDYRGSYAGALGLPLAFAALPIYVHVPKLYGDAFGLSLTVVGVAMSVLRCTMMPGGISRFQSSTPLKASRAINAHRSGSVSPMLASLSSTT